MFKSRDVRDVLEQIDLEIMQKKESDRTLAEHHYVHVYHPYWQWTMVGDPSLLDEEVVDIARYIRQLYEQRIPALQAFLERGCMPTYGEPIDRLAEKLVNDPVKTEKELRVILRILQVDASHARAAEKYRDVDPVAYAAAISSALFPQPGPDESRKSRMQLTMQAYAYAVCLEFIPHGSVLGEVERWKKEIKRRLDGFMDDE